jgi:hypothetical protein
MAKPVGPAVGIPARVPPLVLFAIGAFITVAAPPIALDRQT